jgi:hypothetical protein
VQLEIFDIHGSFNAAAQVNNGVPQSAAFSSASIRIPLPVAGPEIRFYPARRFFVTGNVLGMYFFGYGDFIFAALLRRSSHRDIPPFFAGILKV